VGVIVLRSSSSTPSFVVFTATVGDGVA